MKRTYESIKDLQSRQREQQAIARLQMTKAAYQPRYNHGDRLKALLERSANPESGTVEATVKPEPKKPKRKSPPKATVGGAHQCRTKFYRALKELEARGKWFKINELLKLAGLSKEYLRSPNNADLRAELDRVRARLPQPLFRRPTESQRLVVEALRANPSIKRTRLGELIPQLTCNQMRSALEELIKKGAVVGDRVKGRYFYRLTEFGEMGMKPGVSDES